MNDVHGFCETCGGPLWEGDDDHECPAAFLLGYQGGPKGMHDESAKDLQAIYALLIEATELADFSGWDLLSYQLDETVEYTRTWAELHNISLDKEPK